MMNYAITFEDVSFSCFRLWYLYFSSWLKWATLWRWKASFSIITSYFFSEAYLRNLCSEYSSALSQCGDRPDFLPTIRLLAAALSQLPPHFVTVGSSLLSALMPTDAVVLQVIMIFQLEKNDDDKRSIIICDSRECEVPPTDNLIKILFAIK